MKQGSRAKMISEKKIGVLDIGLSTVIMLLSYYDNTGNSEIINEFGGITRLGFGVNKTGKLCPDNIKKTIDTCNEVIKLAKKEGAEKIIVTATSAIKNAKNKTEFLVGCQTNFNMFPNVLTENEEVKLIYKGATANYADTDAPIILIEVGGYNTYLAFGSKSMLIKSYVLNIGMYDIVENPIARKLFPNLRSPVKAYLKKKFFKERNEILRWLEKRKPIVICTGTIASFYTGILLKKTIQNRSDVENRICSTRELNYLYKKLIQTPIAIRSKIQGMDPERAKVLPAWMEILSHLLKLLQINEFRLTTNGLRTGILKTYLENSSIF